MGAAELCEDLKDLALTFDQRAQREGGEWAEWALLLFQAHNALAAAPAGEQIEGLRAQRDAIIQCAIEAGERSPEGVSSHTMLGDMWERRILELEALLAAGGKG